VPLHESLTTADIFMNIPTKLFYNPPVARFYSEIRLLLVKSPEQEGDLIDSVIFNFRQTSNRLVPLNNPYL
jgi:hypothetical protein